MSCTYNILIQWESQNDSHYCNYWNWKYNALMLPSRGWERTWQLNIGVLGFPTHNLLKWRCKRIKENWNCKANKNHFWEEKNATESTCIRVNYHKRKWILEKGHLKTWRRMKAKQKRHNFMSEACSTTVNTTKWQRNFSLFMSKTTHTLYFKSWLQATLTTADLH